MPDINILEPIDQQFLSIPGPPWWAEISIPGTLTKAYKDTYHGFNFSIATIDGAPVLITGEIKILGGGYALPAPYDYDAFDNNNEWHDRNTSFTTSADWITKSIEIYFKLISHYGTPCTVSLKGFEMWISIAAKIQYLPIMGVG